MLTFLSGSVLIGSLYALYYAITADGVADWIIITTCCTICAISFIAFCVAIILDKNERENKFVPIYTCNLDELPKVNLTLPDSGEI